MKFLSRRAAQVLVDCLVIALALVFAYAIRFEGVPPRLYVRQFLVALPYLALLRVGLFWFFGVYQLLWRYISLRDLPRIGLAVVAGTSVLLLVRFLVQPVTKLIGVVVNPVMYTMPFGVMAAEFLLVGSGLIGCRLAWRVFTEHRQRISRSALSPAQKKRALLIGAGSGGVMVAKEVSSNPDVGFEIVGFLDDDRLKHKQRIHGYPVLGDTNQMSHFAEEADADLAIITMAHVAPASIRRLVQIAEDASLTVQIIPGLYEILSGKVNISKIRNVAIEDLLGRKPVQLERDQINEFLTNKIVMVTGAGGSIGSEICRQVATFKPRQLLLLDQAENPIFHIQRELAHHGVDLVPVIASVVNLQRMEKIFARFQPEVVFHAAAHKHVPLMEANPEESFRNNVGGSANVANLAHRFSAESFVMVSTDKAVRPSSVMGATKRIAEMYVQSLAEGSKTRFITVRFGNVLGSEGSVVPLFKQQIAAGGPITITHPDMKRYFMTIPEASSLVLQAGTMGQGGEIFILEMGEPISILNLARDLIRLSGYSASDIEIKFSGIRPGEKLYEEIKLGEENATKTKHPRIWIGHSSVTDAAGMRAAVGKLLDDLDDLDEVQLRARLHTLVPDYATPEEQPANAERSDKPIGNLRAAKGAQLATTG